jgi:hypothetical protein
MKTPEEWIEELKEHPDCKTVNSSLIGPLFIEAIQRDAIEHLHNNDMPESEIWKDMYEEMRLKWHEARRYLRAANKGAQRNAEALALCQNRYWDMVTSDKRYKERDTNQHKTVVWNWMMMSDEDFRRKFGDPITNEHIYAFRILLKEMLGTSLIKHL